MIGGPANGGNSAVNIGHGVFNNVQGNQHNTVNYFWSPTQVPPQPFNDAPVDLLSTHFTGRGKELARLMEFFSHTQNGIPNRCVVHGMPGLGKTHLVLRYAKISFDQGQYSHIFWISATSVDKLIEGLAKVLDLVGHPDRFMPDQSAKLTMARLWLEDSRDKWLLVFDNVNRYTLPFLRHHLPRRNAQGNILFTTRTVDVAEFLASAAGVPHFTLELPTMDLQDCTTILFGDAGMNVGIVTPSQLRYAEELVQCVGRLPLAVVQAASFMKQTHTELPDMLELYKNGGKMEVLEWENDLTPYEERSIAATFAKQFDLLKKESRDVSNLMKILSFYDPENIPLEMIVNGAKVWLSQHPSGTKFPPIPNSTGLTQFRMNPNGPGEGVIDNVSHVSREFHPLATLIVSSSRLNLAVQKLQNLSLVERRSNDGMPALWIHDLTQCMMQDGVQKEATYRDWLRLSVTLVCDAFRLVKTTNLSRRWAECEKFMPHFRSLNHAWKDMQETNIELMEADRKIAGYLVSRGRYDDAELLYQKAMDIIQTQFGPEHYRTLEAVGNLVWVFGLQGRYSEAQGLAEKGLRGCENVMGVSHPMTLKMVEALADVYECQGRYVDAERLFRRVLAGNPPKGLFVATKLANVCKHLEKYDEAEALLKKAEAVMEKQLGPDHLNTLKTVNDIAGLYQLRGHYAQAEELYKRVLWSNETQLGPENPDTLTARQNLAIIKVCQSQYEDGRLLLLEVLAGREKRLGFDHPATLVTVYSLFEVCSELGRRADAEMFLKRAAHGCKKRLDPSHHLRLMVEENLADTHQSRAEMLCTSFTELWF